MNVKKLNEIFGYGLFLVGLLKLILVILIFIRIGTNILAIFNGKSTNSSEYYSIFSMAIGYFQIILAIGSIIMIFLNIKKEPQVITGYLWGLGALLIEFVTPSIMAFYFVFVECGMYMKAGSKIKNKNFGNDKNYSKIKQNIQNTDWFYENNDK